MDRADSGSAAPGSVPSPLPAASRSRSAPDTGQAVGPEAEAEAEVEAEVAEAEAVVAGRWRRRWRRRRRRRGRRGRRGRRWEMHSLILIESMRQPGAPMPVSVPSRQRSTMFCPAAAGGRFRTVVMKPLFELPFQAS